MKKLLLLLTALLFLPLTNIIAQPEVSTRLTRVLQNSSPEQYVKGILYFRDQVDILSLDARLYAEKADMNRRVYEVLTALQNKANSTQGNMRAYLEAKYATRDVFKYQSFWVANAIAIEAKASVYYELMNSMELAEIDLDAETKLDEPVRRNASATEVKESTEPGLKIINAHLLWQLGITGQGVIVMGEDTGVRHTHSALAARWVGNRRPASEAWLDPAGGTSTPSDCDGHGTHTVGTMVGRTAGGDTVGVAPDAEWIAAKTICSGNSTSNHMAAFQWAMNPDGNINTISDMPCVISNSWYDPGTVNECGGQYVTMFNSVEAAGIAIVFSAGNSGPNASTITMPKNINTNEVNVFATAAIDGAQWIGGSTNPIASFSSRGPSTCGGTGSLQIKPEAAAPGVNVRSCYGSGDNNFSLLSGTSMAAPHVSGAIALLKSANPSLTGHEIKMALYNTARDLGTAGEDNNYGKGLIDVYAAYLLVATGPGSLTNPVPPDNAVNVPLNNTPTISWTNPDSVIRNTVYFSENAQAVQSLDPSAIVLANNQVNTSWTAPAALQYSKTYHWRVVQRGTVDSTLGPVVRFSTQLAPAPAAPKNVTAVWNGANNNTVTVNFTVADTNIYGQQIVVDSSVVFLGDTLRLAKINGNGNSIILSDVPSGIHSFSVRSFDIGYASAPGWSAQTGVGIYANVYTRNNLWLRIRDQQNAYDSIYVNATEATISKVIVKIDTIIHTYDSDLDISLIAPNGTTIDLSSDNGSSGDNYINCVLDDAATQLITSATAPMTGTWKPESPLSALNGISSGGYWVLKVFDDANADTGHVKAWSITLITTAPIPVELSSFTANVDEGKVNLNWVTASETNNMGFEVEKSVNNGEFAKIGFVGSKGTTTETSVYRFTDNSSSAGKVSYRLKQLDFSGTFEYSNAIEVDINVPSEFSLMQNYPNPFNPSTTIRFGLPSDSKVKLVIFDAVGQEIMSLIDGSLTAGIHTKNFNASGLNSGIYFYKLEATGKDGKVFSETKKMLLMK